MPNINKFNQDTSLSTQDKLLGSGNEAGAPTKNYSLSSIMDFFLQKGYTDPNKIALIYNVSTSEGLANGKATSGGFNIDLDSGLTELRISNIDARGVDISGIINEFSGAKVRLGALNFGADNIYAVYTIDSILTSATEAILYLTFTSGIEDSSLLNETTFSITPLGVSSGTGGVGIAISVDEEGVDVTDALRSINYVGTGITATGDGNGNVTVTVNASTSHGDANDGAHISGTTELEYTGSSLTRQYAVIVNNGFTYTLNSASLPSGWTRTGEDVTIPGTFTGTGRITYNVTTTHTADQTHNTKNIHIDVEVYEAWYTGSQTLEPQTFVDNATLQDRGRLTNGETFEFTPVSDGVKEYLIFSIPLTFSTSPTFSISNEHVEPDVISVGGGRYIEYIFPIKRQRTIKIER